MALTGRSRKQQMIIQSRELEVLQRRIREAEERLKRQSVSYSKASSPQTNQGEEGGAGGEEQEQEQEEGEGQASGKDGYL